ncbi:hypothetical protein [Ferrimonas balearica]|uniref:hypothetical protein n=1 Tax=Ferrimonas balearica TaxID=44012 RepID=UPI001C99E8FA|nr:hypothetical protein [Ferrimonas balearica]MBY5993869.1 hypothetical protein [Ferrimonas balearica]
MQIVGGYLLSLELPQNRAHLTLNVTVDDARFNSVNVKFSNRDGSPIRVEMNHLSISLIHHPESDLATMGELEEVYRIDGGFGLWGDFGTVVVYCDDCSLPESQIR